MSAPHDDAADFWATPTLGSDPAAPQHPDGATAGTASDIDEVTVVLDNTMVHTEAATQSLPAPGIDPTMTGTAATWIPHEASAVWHGRGTSPPSNGGSRRRARTARRRGWVLPSLVLLCVAAYLGWRHLPGHLDVKNVSVSADKARPTCGDTVTFTGELTTNGATGNITYRWRRSDGTTSNTLTARGARGAHTLEVALRWTFNGPGTYKATADLEVLTPYPVTSRTSVLYTCRP